MNGKIGKVAWFLIENIAGERGDLASDEHTSFAARFISSSKDGWTVGFFICMARNMRIKSSSIKYPSPLHIISLRWILVPRLGTRNVAEDGDGSDTVTLVSACFFFLRCMLQKVLSYLRLAKDFSRSVLKHKWCYQPCLKSFEGF